MRVIKPASIVGLGVGVAGLVISSWKDLVRYVRISRM
jgi:hypothetical protein